MGRESEDGSQENVWKNTCMILNQINRWMERKKQDNPCDNWKSLLWTTVLLLEYSVYILMYGTKIIFCVFARMGASVP
ncbi:hypothetical protein E2320_008635 [Naja naja]|nr:hypothetical protein E2320_008635 [Naja naja]